MGQWGIVVGFLVQSPTQPPTQDILVAVSPELKRLGRKVHHSYPSKWKFTNASRYTPTPFMSSLLTDGQFYCNFYQPQVTVIFKYFRNIY